MFFLRFVKISLAYGCMTFINVLNEILKALGVKESVSKQKCKEATKPAREIFLVSLVEKLDCVILTSDLPSAQVISSYDEV